MRSMPVFGGLRLLLVGLHLLYGALLAAVLFPLGGAPWRRRLTSGWSRQLLTLLGIRVEAVGELARIGGGLLVANHISFIDIFVINALLPATFVAKSEVARWPLIGWLSRRGGTVFIERGSRKAAHRTQQNMLQLLGCGQRLAIFPEGTSTAGDQVLPFHAALFQSAIDAGVPVHAIALSYHQSDGTRSEAAAYVGDISLLDCLVKVLKSRGLVARVTLAASFTAPLPDRRHLAHRSHQAISAVLQQMPAVDLANRERNPSNEAAQPFRNEAATIP